MGAKLEKYIPEPNSGCHLWVGSVDKDGYGTIRRADGAHLKAHRESYRYHCVDPGENQVLHTCDTPCCINPEHLYEGDPAANGRDKRIRMRSRNMYGACRALRGVLATGEPRAEFLAVANAK